jgi:hypothetical protein
VSPLTPEQRRNRARVESLIRLMAPGLNLVLALGERLSRVVEPVDHDYYPARVDPGSRPSLSNRSGSASD